MRDEKHEWHYGGAQAERDFAGLVQRAPRLNQVAGKPSPAQTADPRRGVGHPGKCADSFDVEATRVVQVFREPEKIEIPGRITEEFGDDDAPKLAEPE